MTGNFEAKFRKVRLLLFIAFPGFDKLLFGLSQPFACRIGFLQHASLGHFHTFVRLISLGLKGRIPGRDGGLKLRSQPLLGFSRLLQLLRHIGTNRGHFALQRLDLAHCITLGLGFLAELQLHLGALLPEPLDLLLQLLDSGQRRISFDDDVVMCALQRRQIGFQRLPMLTEDLFALFHRRYP